MKKLLLGVILATSFSVSAQNNVEYILDCKKDDVIIQYCYREKVLVKALDNDIEQVNFDISYNYGGKVYIGPIGNQKLMPFFSLTNKSDETIYELYEELYEGGKKGYSLYDGNVLVGKCKQRSRQDRDPISKFINLR